MSILTITCILSLFPALYPSYILLKKKDINLFDLLILFHTLNFVITPLLNGHLRHWDVDSVITVFVYYNIFIWLLLLIDLIWKNKRGNEINIINITKYIQQNQSIIISKVGIFLIFIILIISLVFYLPRATILLRIEDEAGIELDYQLKSLVAIFGSIWNILGLILTLDFIYSYKKKQINKLKFCLTLAYFIMLLFFPRRVFICGALSVFIILYSIYREAINKKLIITISFCGIIFYLIYFPFYNLMRTSGFYFDTKHPLESLSELVATSIDNWNYRVTDEKAEGSSGSRSLGLYHALHDLIKHNPNTKNGALTIADIDLALPKIINPNKGEGSAPILEKMTKHYVDQADSVLLLSYGDFHLFGAFYAVFLFYFILQIYNAYAYLWKKIFKSKLVPLYILYFMISFVWNIESTINGMLSWFFGSIATLIIILFIEKGKIIYISN